MTGLPCAQASNSTMPNESTRDGSTSISAAASRACLVRSLTGPRGRTLARASWGRRLKYRPNSCAICPASTRQGDEIEFVRRCMASEATMAPLSRLTRPRNSTKGLGNSSRRSTAAISPAAGDGPVGRMPPPTTWMRSGGTCREARCSFSTVVSARTAWALLRMRT